MSDLIVRARLFRVENMGKKDATFSDSIEQVWDLSQDGEYTEISTGVFVRLERFAIEKETGQDTFYTGEIVRQQVENIPPIAHRGKPLEGQTNPLGHRSAFRYHAQTRTLLLERRQNAATPTRVHGLIRKKLRRHRGFWLDPVLEVETMRRLSEGAPRHVDFRIAAPDSASVFEDNPLNIKDEMLKMIETFGGMTLTAQVGFPRGKKDMRLKSPSVHQLVRWAMQNRGVFQAMKVKLAEDAEPIDVFGEQVKFEKMISLDSEDVDRNYRKRHGFLKSSMNAALPAVEDYFLGGG